MTPPVLTSEPSEFTAGETVRWTRDAGVFPPSDGWTLKYAFRGPSAVDVAADGSTGTYVATLTAAGTGILAAGRYEWWAFVEKGAAETLERYEVDRGITTVNPNLITAAAGARQSHPERSLALIERQIEELLKTPAESLTFEQRTVQKRNLEELERTRKRYLAEIAAQRNGGQIGRPVEVTFVR